MEDIRPEDIEVGDLVTILVKPSTWSSHEFEYMDHAICGLYKLSFPHSTTVQAVGRGAMRTTGNYGWNLHELIGNKKIRITKPPEKYIRPRFKLTF